MDENYERLKRALIKIRDYKVPHCRGDFGAQAECILENDVDAIADVEDLLS